MGHMSFFINNFITPQMLASRNFFWNFFQNAGMIFFPEFIIDSIFFCQKEQWITIFEFLTNQLFIPLKEKLTKMNEMLLLKPIKRLILSTDI